MTSAADAARKDTLMQAQNGSRSDVVCVGKNSPTLPSPAPSDHQSRHMASDHCPCGQQYVAGAFFCHVCGLPRSASGLYQNVKEELPPSPPLPKIAEEGTKEPPHTTGEPPPTRREGSGAYPAVRPA
jgi:hypothetical protein